ncbi:MAG: DNA gyrase inhibitor YacG [Oligoflexales bacterium]
MKAARIVRCPRCRKSVAYVESNPWRPFCSERCKIIDVAAWAEEKYVMHEPLIKEEED